MDLSIQKLSKAFNQRTVLLDLSFRISGGERFAITGSNGSGKSTLLKILSGGLIPSGGTIQYFLNGYEVLAEQVYRYVHFVAPYNTVIEELTLPELFRMHQQLGLLLGFQSYEAWHRRLDYAFPIRRPIKTYSSGMKQRVKLGLAILDDRPLILLDEPGSNLDAQGKAWCFSLLDQVRPHQTIVIATNDPAEIDWCTNGLEVGSK